MAAALLTPTEDGVVSDLGPAAGDDPEGLARREVVIHAEHGGEAAVTDLRVRNVGSGRATCPAPNESSCIRLPVRRPRVFSRLDVAAA